MITEILITIFTVLLGLLFWFIKRNFNQLEKSDIRIENKVDKMDNKINKIDSRVSYIEGRISNALENSLAPGHSPRKLNEEGKRIFDESKIENIVIENKDMLFDAVKKENPQTAYDVQETAKKAMNLLQENSDILIRLKNGAFKAGASIESVLFVGSIYLRDIALKEFNFDYISVSPHFLKPLL